MATQAERTASTCERLLDATVASLIERGYRGTSTPEICRRAGVSRGAQLHHYPTKESLVAAAVDHLLTQRVTELQDRLAKAPAGMLDLEDAASFLWKVYTGHTFYAWLEIVVAARTDEELRKVVAALDERLVAKAERLVQKFLLPFASDPKEIAATTRLILAIFDGLATHRILSHDDALAKNALRVAARNGLFVPKTKEKNA
ncbi:MAG: TetR/AcrR family transcriptional regulator [Labilithrix sp.]|nr:TetR/AcrR family transcriptional regulator [Labilithrix sp.]